VRTLHQRVLRRLRRVAHRMRSRARSTRRETTPFSRSTCRGNKL
jgi:hypothetical protein